MTTGWRFVRHEPTAVGRYVGRGAETTVAAVLLVSLPSPTCRMRTYATRGRYEGLERRAGLRLLNEEVRTISRVIVHPQWRGLGLAVRLVRHALTHAETVYTEALAAMGRVHPFFERAGMQRYDPPPRDADARLVAALREVGLTPIDLACRWDECRIGPSDSSSGWIRSEIERWAASAVRTTQRKALAMSNEQLRRVACERLLARPVYYLARTPMEHMHESD